VHLLASVSVAVFISRCSLSSVCASPFRFGLPPKCARFCCRSVLGRFLVRVVLRSCPASAYSRSSPVSVGLLSVRQSSSRLVAAALVFYSRDFNFLVMRQISGSSYCFLICVLLDVILPPFASVVRAKDLAVLDLFTIPLPRFLLPAR
jgi:hypothetical protein